MSPAGKGSSRAGKGSSEHGEGSSTSSWLNFKVNNYRTIDHSFHCMDLR